MIGTKISLIDRMFKMSILALMHVVSRSQKLRRDFRIVPSDRSFQRACTAIFRSATLCGFGYSLL